MKSVSERLAQEDQILREIRLSLSTFQTMDSTGPRRKGAVYASSAITTGARLYEQTQTHGFTDPNEFRRALPGIFKEKVFKPNLRDGAEFGESLRRQGWAQTIVPGFFFAKGWTQEHYMSLWRQVIVRHARTIAFNKKWQWSLGCTEEFLIGLQHAKRMLRSNSQPIVVSEALNDIRFVMDVLDRRGVDFKKHYDLWRQITLTAEAAEIMVTS